MNLLNKVKLTDGDIIYLRDVYKREENKFSNMDELKAEVKFLSALTFCDNLEEMEEVASQIQLGFNSKNRSYEEILKMSYDRIELLEKIGIIERE